MSSDSIPTDALAANWPSEILDTYLAGVQKERDTGTESDEAMSTDDETEFDETDESTTTTSTDLFELHDSGRPADIASDDGGFSSEDEFGDEGQREQQSTRRALVLGRPPQQLLQLHTRDLVVMHEAYMKQLEDADTEYAELTGAACDIITRRDNSTEYREAVDVKGDDVDAIVYQLRMRSPKEIWDTGKKDLVYRLVLLAQALFRREREIKRILFRE